MTTRVRSYDINTIGDAEHPRVVNRRPFLDVQS